MSIRTQCPRCSAAFSVAEESIGREMTCSSCQQPFAIAAAPPSAFPAHPEPVTAQYAGGAGPPAVTVPKMSMMAVFSLILGALGVCTGGVTALVGLILGIIGIRQISASDGQLTGRGLAIAGTAVSGACLLLMAVSIPLLLLPSLTLARNQAKQTLRASRVAQLSKSVMMYAEDYDDVFPTPPSNWPKLMFPYYRFRQMEESPFAPGAGRAYAINENLAGVRMSAVYAPSRTVLFFEAALGAPAAGGPELLPKVPRHRDRYVVGFVDGHVADVPKDEVRDLSWKPGPPQKRAAPTSTSPREGHGLSDPTDS